MSGADSWQAQVKRRASLTTRGGPANKMSGSTHSKLAAPGIIALDKMRAFSFVCKPSDESDN